MKILSFMPAWMAVSCAWVLSLGACTKTNPAGTDSGNEPISLTAPVAYSGNVPEAPDPDAEPRVSAAFAPYVGVWKQSGSGKTLVFLPDGRIASGASNETPDLGVLIPEAGSNRFHIRWVMSDVEYFSISVSGNTLTILPFDFIRTGSAASAQAAYDGISNSLKAYAGTNAAKFPVGPVANKTADPHDPKPNNVIKGASVYTTGNHFMSSFTATRWYDLPDGRIEGFDGYSRTDVWLLPNGRFFMQLWLWDGVNPVSKIESFKHQMSWGKYTVIKGSDVIKGDVVNFYYDNGGTAAYRTVGGQSCFLTKNTVYHSK